MTRIDTCCITRYVTTSAEARRSVPKPVWQLPIGQRIKWARETARLSHDRLVALIGRSNRGHLIKIEKGKHLPGPELRRLIADATNVPRELLEDEDDDEEADPVVALLNIVRQLIREETSRDR